MHAMVLCRPGEALQAKEVVRPCAGPRQLRVRVTACGICRTDLHVIDGELTQPALPIIPGHQIVGIVDQLGAGR
jgi:propanol-preferring alcohol dehydrogenase